MLGYKAFEWTIEDTIVMSRISGYIGLAQSQVEMEQLFAQMAQKGVDRQLLKELFPMIQKDVDFDLLKKLKLNNTIVPDSLKWNLSMPSFMASNNWVISAELTKSSKPILANDPHLEINRLPAVWYEVAIESTDSYTHGATMPGIPTIIIGRSKALAWGVTYAFMDASDCWIEKCKDGNYFKDGKWHAFIKRKEIIKRKKSKALDIVFYENEHGTLDGNPNEEGYYLSRKWSGDKSGAQSIKVGLKLMMAASVKEGMALAGQIEGAFSWVFADTKGNIGYQMSGLMPIRKSGQSGFTPMIGWTSDNDWQGFVAADKLPRLMNPEKGYIVTANHQLNHLGTENPINIAMGDYRARRIEEMILENNSHTIEDSKTIQYDCYSLQAKDYMAYIKPLLPDNDNAEILRLWDFKYDTLSEGAYLFEQIYKRLFAEVFGTALGLDVNDFLQNKAAIYYDFYQNFDDILLSEESAWFLNRSKEEIYRDAINKALQEDVREWGNQNKLSLNHLILGSQLPKLFGFDKGPYAIPGGRATVHQGQIFNNGGRQTSFAPSFRMITDMTEQSLHTNLPGGVSDRRFSRLYFNDFGNWLGKKYRKYHFDK